MIPEKQIEERIAELNTKLQVLNGASRKEFENSPGTRNVELLRFYYIEALKYEAVIKELDWVLNGKLS